MSDLHCPATILVCRHGDADYPHPKVLSDEGGWLTELGREQVAGLAQPLRTRRIAAIYTSQMERAVQSGQELGRLLALDSQIQPGLQEFSAGALAGRNHNDPELMEIFGAWRAGQLDVSIPGGESGAELLQRYRDALETIADQHRGETVVAFSHGAVMAFCLPRLPNTFAADAESRPFIPNAGYAEIEVDADGIELCSWPGSADRSVI